MPYLVSVVLPTYNRATTLKRAIDSVLNQTFTDLELIVVDDGSTDDTSAVLADYAGLDNLKVIATSRRGCAAARNVGVNHSQGRYIAFQDSDAEWTPEKLAKAMACLQDASPETGIFYSDMLQIHSDGNLVEFKSPETNMGVLVDETTRDYQVHCIGLPSTVIRRECLEAAGCFDEALPRLIDLEMFIRLSDKFRFIHCHELLTRYQVGEGISTDSLALVIARQYLIRKYYDRLSQQKHHLAKQYLLLANALEENGQHWKSLLSVLKAFATAPHDAKIRNEILAVLRWRGRELAGRLRGLRRR